LAESLEQIAIRELASDRCVCGEEKVKNQSFCRKCYFTLPKQLRFELYKPISDGYAEIYDQAKQYLQCETDRLQQGGLL
jgi:hypothetical protein